MTAIELQVPYSITKRQLVIIIFSSKLLTLLTFSIAIFADQCFITSLIRNYVEFNPKHFVLDYSMMHYW